MIAKGKVWSFNDFYRTEIEDDNREEDNASVADEAEEDEEENESEDEKQEQPEVPTDCEKSEFQTVDPKNVEIDGIFESFQLYFR